MNNFFATNIKFLREQHGWSQEKLVDELNKLDPKNILHRSTVGRWENLDSSPNMTSVIRVADLFNIPIADLISRDLRLKNSSIDENMKKELLRTALIEKGFIQPDSDFTEEEFERAMQLYTSFKKMNEEK